MSPVSRLDRVDRELMLRAAIRQMSRDRKIGVPLWAVVMDTCGVGSTSATEICVELGWNPAAKATDELPCQK